MPVTLVGGLGTLGITESAAELLTASLPTPLYATARYKTPFTVLPTLATVRVAAAVPAYGEALGKLAQDAPPLKDTSQRYRGAGLPLAATVNCALAPPATV